MIKIYHSRRARSARVIWLLEELGVPYELETLDFKPETLQAPEYRKLHPLGLVPVIEDEAITMFESGAIVEYLLEKYGQGRLSPLPSTPERAEYLQWFHYGEATLARHMSDIVRYRFRRGDAEQDAAVLTDLRVRFHAALVVVDRKLVDRPFICGATFSAADIMIAYGIVMGRIIRELPPELPGVSAYVDRLKERPAYAKAWA
jgi:glutathione S-transferase